MSPYDPANHPLTDRPGSEESHGVPHISLSKDIEEMLERRIIFLEKTTRELADELRAANYKIAESAGFIQELYELVKECQN